MTKLSNSAMESYYRCPQLYVHQYVSGWRQSPTPSYFDFGQRMHELLQVHYCGHAAQSTVLSTELELEAAAMLEAYKASYPAEDFDVVDCEMRFELAVPDTTHTYIGRIDMLVRDHASGMLRIFETKTESRGSKRNHPATWAVRHQASLYQWAASELTGEKIDSTILNVCTRGTAGKQIAPSFRRDTLHRTPEQIQQALSDLTYAADQMEWLTTAERIPRNTAACVNEKGFCCEMYGNCWLGTTEKLVQLSNPYSYLELK